MSKTKRITLPLTDCSSRQQLRARLALTAMAMNPNARLPHETEIAALAELSAAAGYADLPTDRAGWFKLLGRHTSPDLAAAFAHGKVRPRDVLAFLNGRADASDDKPSAPGDDPDAYRPAKECIDDDRFITAASVTKYLDAHPDIRTRPVMTKDGRPHPRRRLVHMGDWHRTIHAEGVADLSSLNADTVDAMVRSVEQRKDKARADKAKESAPATSPLLSLAKKIARK